MGRPLTIGRRGIAREEKGRWPFLASVELKTRRDKESEEDRKQRECKYIEDERECRTSRSCVDFHSHFPFPICISHFPFPCIVPACSREMIVHSVESAPFAFEPRPALIRCRPGDGSVGRLPSAHASGHTSCLALPCRGLARPRESARLRVSAVGRISQSC